MTEDKEDHAFKSILASRKLVKEIGGEDYLVAFDKAMEMDLVLAFGKERAKEEIEKIKKMGVN